MKKQLIMGVIQSCEGVLLQVIAVSQLIPIIGKLFFLSLSRDEKSMLVFLLFMWLALIIGAIFTGSLGAAKLMTYSSQTSVTKHEETPVFKNINISPQEEPEKRPASIGEWQCPNCGQVNQNYVGTCGCGTPKP